MTRILGVASTTRILGVALLALATTACDRPPEQDLDLVTERELEMQVDSLTRRADALSEKVASKRSGPAAAARPAEPDPKQLEKEKAAYEKWKEMMEARSANDMEAVKKHIAEIERDFADTRAIREIQSVKQEMAVVGKDAVAIDAEKWFVGNTSIDDGKATLLVFWEVWCPHCKREVPALQAKYDKYKGQGLNMVGVTQVTNGKTDDDVVAFIQEKGITYPIAKASPAVNQAYNVSGIPAAAVVKDGKIVWRGHPAQLNDAVLEGFLGS